MGLVETIRRRTPYAIGPVLGLLAVSYFAYHVVHGDRGLVASHRLEVSVSEAQATLGKLRAQVSVLEHRVRLLRLDSLDVDLLDEVVRRNLGYGRRDEIVIVAPDQLPR